MSWEHCSSVRSLIRLPSDLTFRGALIPRVVIFGLKLPPPISGTCKADADVIEAILFAVSKLAAYLRRNAHEKKAAVSDGGWDGSFWKWASVNLNKG